MMVIYNVYLTIWAPLNNSRSLEEQLSSSNRDKSFYYDVLIEEVIFLKIGQMFRLFFFFFGQSDQRVFSSSYQCSIRYVSVQTWLLLPIIALKNRRDTIETRQVGREVSHWWPQDFYIA